MISFVRALWHAATKTYRVRKHDAALEIELQRRERAIRVDWRKQMLIMEDAVR